MIGRGILFYAERAVQKSFNPGHFIDPRVGVSLFPIHQSRFIAADYFGHIDLSESQIESSFANGFADCSWLGWIAFYLGKVWTNGATNPA